MKVNKIYNENCLGTLSKIPDNFIDLTVTSPPYDKLREYNGYSFDFESMAKELYRTTKDGGIVCWNVFDSVIKGSRSGNSLRQCLFFQELGFDILDYLIYEKNSIAFPSNKNSKRYTQIFEFVFVLSKGKPKTVNIIIDKKNKWANKTSFDGKVSVNEFGVRNSIWKYATSQNDKSNHPAVMPEKLAEDLILSYSNREDLVYDPFAGSGTTAKMSIINNRNYLGSEVSEEYCKIIRRRLDGQTPKLF